MFPGPRGTLIAAALMLVAVSTSVARASEPAPPQLHDGGTLALGTTTAVLSAFADSGPRQVYAVFATADDYGWGSQSEKVTLPGAGFAAITLHDLEPGTRYHYFFRDGASATGEAFFTTAPAGAPVNTRVPAIVNAGDGSYICDPGGWDNAVSLSITSTPSGTRNGVVMPVRCLVTAVNAAGTSTAVSSDALTNDGPGLLTTAPPTIAAGAPSIRVSDQVLTCSVAYSSGGGFPRVTYTWLRDGVELAKGSEYTLVPDDAGRDLTCEVRVGNAVGTSAATSRPIHVAAAPGAPTPGAGPQPIGPTATVAHRLTAAALHRLAKGRSAAIALRRGRLAVGLHPGRGRLTVRVLRGRTVLARGSAQIRTDGAALRRVTLRRTTAARRHPSSRPVLELTWHPATGPVLRATA